jgi:hypothetical protein
LFLPVTPSTALSKESIVRFASGKLVASVAATTAADNFGILAKAITSADSDYASDRLVPVLVPTEKHALVEADVTATLVAGDVGLEVDLTDASTLNRGASTIDAAKVVRFISTTKCLAMLKLNGSY